MRIRLGLLSKTPAYAESEWYWLGDLEGCYERYGEGLKGEGKESKALSIPEASSTHVVARRGEAQGSKHVFSTSGRWYPLKLIIVQLCGLYEVFDDISFVETTISNSAFN